MKNSSYSAREHCCVDAVSVDMDGCVTTSLVNPPARRSFSQEAMAIFKLRSLHFFTARFIVLLVNKSHINIVTPNKSIS
jgi:hypothetical protein